MLKKDLDFKGIIFTDSLLMGAISKNYKFHDAAILSAKAGVDVLLYSANKYDNKSIVDEVTIALKFAISSGDLPIERVEESFEKIMNKKLQYFYP